MNCFQLNSRIQKTKWWCVSAVLIALFHTAAVAQQLAPATRLHEKNSPYTFYNNNFLSGFLQNASQQRLSDGFLQIPFVGDPLLIYVGEKDSTQFMAYASGYTLEKTNDDTYQVDYTRYHVQASLQNMPGYCVQKYQFPDTVADKGFLLDIDNAGWGSQNEDMDVVFVDKQTIRAYKRSRQSNSGVPELFYVAHFSHPFNKWNVRREVVRLDNGEREHRCKAAFMFDLRAGEALTVTSAVSALSTDAAFAQLQLNGAKRHFNDQRKPTPKAEPTAPLLAQNSAKTTVTNRAKVVTKQVAKSTATQKSQASTQPVQVATTNNHLAATYQPVKWLELSTRKAELQAAFTAALKQLLQSDAKAKRAVDALGFIDAITPYYQRCEAKAEQGDVVQTDSLLRHHAQSLFTGQPMSNEQAAWFVLNALGFVPCGEMVPAQLFRLERPLFNVATLYLPRTRRFILHTKNNTSRNLHIKQATLMHQPLNADYTFSREQLAKGGVMEVKMQQ